MPVFSIHSDEYFMGKALQEAELAAAADEVPVGAVIVCENRIIAKAHNQVERLNDPTAHAELVAITAACEYLGAKYLSDCTLYVTLEPCAMCAQALNWAKIARIVYASTDPKKGFSAYTPSLLHPKTEVVSGIMEYECRDMVQRFFQQKR